MLYRAAWYAWQRGNAAETKQLALASLKVRQKLLGREHTDTWWGIAMVAQAHALSGRWDEAEKLQERVLTGFETKLGAEHPQTLTSMASLATIYRN